MEVAEIVIPYRRSDEFHLYPIGDEHGGTKHCAEDKVEAKYKQIARDPLGMFVQMGDKCELITMTDPRWGYDYTADWVKEDNVATNEEDWWCNMARPAIEAKIGDTGLSKGLGALWGNHEWTFRKHSHHNFQENVCKKARIRDLGFSCLYHFHFRREHSKDGILIKGFFTHGSGGAQTRGGKLMKLRKIMNQVDADFYCMGHVHDLIVETRETLETDREGRIRNKRTYGVTTGSFLKTYTQGVEPSYGELRNFDPVPIGCPVITINPDDRIINIEAES